MFTFRPGFLSLALSSPSRSCCSFAPDHFLGSIASVSCYMISDEMAMQRLFRENERLPFPLALGLISADGKRDVYIIPLKWSPQHAVDLDRCRLGLEHMQRQKYDVFGDERMLRCTYDGHLCGMGGFAVHPKPLR